MKEYPITEETLDNIGVMKKSSAGCYSAASLALGLFLSSGQALCFAGPEVAPWMRGFWIAVTIVSVVIAVGAFCAAQWFNGREKSVLDKIKEETTHVS